MYAAADLFSLAGKTALVTGASGFLGRTFCRCLLENGARVVAFGRSERTQEEVKAWQERYGADRAIGYCLDMHDLPALEDLLQTVLEREGSIEILVNNAHELGAATGFNVPEGALDRADFGQWKRNMMGGVHWPATTIKHIGNAMRAKGQGVIINVASMYGIVAPSPRLYEGTSFLNPPGYSAAKAALLALTRYTASFWGQSGIRCNALVPGPFSDIDSQGENSVPPEDPFLQRLSERTCLGRVGNPQELVGALLFLASGASSFMTGHALVVDGGWTIV